MSHIPVSKALAALPGPRQEQSALLFTHGTLSVKVYAPRGSDPQTPHRRDEVYVILAGEGMFFNGETRHAFHPGDVLFVAAGVEHRFEEFTADFATWVLFYGPEGGEASHPIIPPSAPSSGPASSRGSPGS